MTESDHDYQGLGFHEVGNLEFHSSFSNLHSALTLYTPFVDTVLLLKVCAVNSH